MLRLKRGLQRLDHQEGPDSDAPHRVQTMWYSPAAEQHESCCHENGESFLDFRVPNKNRDLFRATVTRELALQAYCAGHMCFTSCTMLSTSIHIYSKR